MAKQMGSRGYVRGPQRKKGLRATRDVKKHGPGNATVGIILFTLAIIGFAIQLASYG